MNKCFPVFNIVRDNMIKYNIIVSKNNNLGIKILNTKENLYVFPSIAEDEIQFIWDNVIEVKLNKKSIYKVNNLNFYPIKGFKKRVNTLFGCYDEESDNKFNEDYYTLSITDHCQGSIVWSIYTEKELKDNFNFINTIDISKIFKPVEKIYDFDKICHRSNIYILAYSSKRGYMDLIQYMYREIQKSALNKIYENIKK